MKHACARTRRRVAIDSFIAFIPLEKARFLRHGARKHAYYKGCPGRYRLQQYFCNADQLKAERLHGAQPRHYARL
jgi:hypothetical protein